MCQSNPLLRCAAWSVAVVPPFQAAWTPGQVKMLGASYLPGLCQTAYRAELYAVAYGLHCAAEAHAPVRIWTDCKGVLLKFHALVRGHSRNNPNRNNADLWTWVIQSVDRLGSENVLLFKVPAHRALHSATTRKEAWMFFHNDYADKAARLANQSRPSGFWQVWEQHARAVVTASNLFNRFGNYKLRLDGDRFRPVSMLPQILSLNLSAYKSFCEGVFFGAVEGRHTFTGCTPFWSRNCAEGHCLVSCPGCKWRWRNP